MSALSPSLSVRGRWTPTQALLYGTLAVGVLDGLAAVAMAATRGTGPIRLFQGIAFGMLGRDSYSGGWGTALLGLGLHFVVAFGVTAVYLVASRVVPALAQRPLLYGPFYGVLAFLVMNYIVIPLSVIGTVIIRWPNAMSGVVIHILFVGIPAALAVSRTRT